MWSIALVLGFIATAFIFVYIAAHMDDKNFPLKLFFICIAIVILVINLASLPYILEENSITTAGIIGSVTSAYRTIMFVMVFTFSYMLIYFIYLIFMWMARLNRG